MRAVVKQRPEPGVTVAEVPDPVPEDGEILARVRTVGVCGSDLHAYEWIPEYEWLSPHLPVILGHEIIGEILQVPHGSDLRPGEVVAVRPRIECGRCWYCLGGVSQHCAQRRRLGFERPGGLAPLLRAPQHSVFRIPEEVGADSAALLEPLSVAVHALRSVSIRPGSATAVLGAGAIGLLSAQVLRASGAGRVLVVGVEADRDGGGLAVAESHGADSLVAGDPRLGESAGQYETVVVAAGAPQAMSTALELVARTGHVVVVGLGIGAWQDNVDSWVRSEVRIHGAHGAQPADWLDARDLLASHRVDGTGIVSHRYPLERAPEAFAEMAAGRARKVLIYPNHGAGSDELDS